MKKSHYPKSVKVGKARYSVTLLPFIEEIDGNVTRGYCETKDKHISLLSAQPEPELFATLIHEALHAISKEHQIKLSHKTIYDLEGPIAQFLKDNFHIFPKR